MASDDKLRDLRRIESKINENLFLICVLVTLVTMILLVIDFFTRGRFLPPRMDFFYLSVVVIYSLHKELIRWLGQKKATRNGEIFVYAWVILTTALYAINFFSKDYFSYSIEGYPLGTLRDISLLTMEVLGLFIFTRILKLLFLLKK